MGASQIQILGKEEVSNEFDENFYSDYLKQNVFPTTDAFPPDSAVFSLRWNSKKWMDIFNTANSGDAKHKMRVAAMLATLAACRTESYFLPNGKVLSLKGMMNTWRNQSYYDE